MATYLIGGALALIVAAIIWKMVRDRQKGKSSCGCDCGGCSGCAPTQQK